MSQDLTAADLTWNEKTYIPETKATGSTYSLQVDGGPDSNYLLVIRNTGNNVTTATVKAGDFWMKDQGDKTIETTTSHSYSHIFGPFESGRFMQSDSTIKVTHTNAGDDKHVVAGLLKVPKP